MRWLMCEGLCNPDFPALVQRVAALDVYGGEQGPRGDEKLWAALRLLRHTVHHQRSGDRWVCATCGTERR